MSSPTPKRGFFYSFTRIVGFTLLAFIAMLIFAFVVVAIFRPPTPNPSTSAAEQPQTAATATPESSTVTPLPTVTQPSAATPAPTNTPVPSPTPTPVTLASTTLTALGSSNRDAPTRLDVSQVADAIAITWAINDNLSEDMVRRTAQLEAATLLRAIADSGTQYNLLTLTGTFSMVDAFGNSSEMPVVWLTFNKTTVDKINWERFINADIYTIADSVKLHPVFELQN